MLIRIFLRLFESFNYGGGGGIRSGVFDPYHAKAKKCLYAFFYACSNPLIMAEGVGFEPTEPAKAQRFSRPPPSTTRTPLP